MDYFEDAFGGFNPAKDKDAALKFSLCVLMMDHRIEELLALIKGVDGLGGIEGVPGWLIEKRGDDEHIGYESWPKEARFKASVDPDGYLLTYPEFHSDKETFYKYVQAIVAIYETRHPEFKEVAQMLKEAISNTMTTQSKYPALSYYLVCYLNQDFEVISGGAEEALLSYKNTETKEEQKKMMKEIQLLIDSSLCEKDLQKIILDETDCGYYYPNEWHSGESWLRHMLVILRE